MSADVRPHGALLGRRAVLPAELEVRPSIGARKLAALLAIGLGLFAIFAALAPWQQTVRGSGEVIAFSPEQRKQRIEATLSGVVARWLVREGDQVKAGAPLVELVDNDRERIERLQTQRGAAEQRVTGNQGRADTLRDRLEALIASQAAQVEAGKAEVDIAGEQHVRAERALDAARAQLEVAQLQLARQRELRGEGLVSERELELALLAERRAQAETASAEAALRAADRGLTAERAALARIRASTQADIEAARAALREAENAYASSQAELATIGVDIARQEAGLVRAPRDGVILSIVAREGGEQVSQGDALAYLVPDTEDRAVALHVDGNDAALIQAGAPVRLQFEGWPAIQFSGWPAVARGTFGGHVAFVDAAGDLAGDFRVVVLPDRAGDPWPPARYLRQGVRAKGWFLLREVSVGYELWRRLNGFPPALSSRTTGAEPKE